MITIYSDTSIHKRIVATYPDLPTLAKNFKGKPQDFIYVENDKEISWTVALREMQHAKK